MDQTQDDRLVAYHEAAHAVVAYVLGRIIVRITVVQDQETAGSIVAFNPLLEFSMDRPTARRVVTDMIIMLAGPYGKEIAQKRDGRLGADAEYQQMLSLVEHHFAGPVDKTRRFLQQLCDTAWTILHWHWPIVEALSKALQERGVLYASEIEQIIRTEGGADSAKRACVRLLIRPLVDKMVSNPQWREHQRHGYQHFREGKLAEAAMDKATSMNGQ